MSAARRAFRPIDVIEAAYTWVEEPSAWLAGIARAARDLDDGHGLYVRLDDVRDPASPEILCAAWEGAVDATWVETDAVRREIAALAPETKRALYAPGPPVVRARERVARLPDPARRQVAATLARLGLSDVLGVFARDVAGETLHIGIPTSRRSRWHPRTLHRLCCVSAHLVSALRLRLGGPPGPDHPSTEAVYEPSGELAHARGAIQDRGVRERLSRAVCDAERARGPLRDEDPDAALAIWRGLVDGTWSLVDHWDTDGRRYVLVRRNAPRVVDPKSLTAPERDVLAFLAMGHPEKYVAYLLGLSPSTIATHFASARRKLRLRSREELIGFFGAGAPAR